jgi:lysophospholipid hydrolase
LHCLLDWTHVPDNDHSVSSVRTLEEAKVTKGCLYMQMPVQDYGTLQWGKCEEILEKGYRASRDMLQKAQAEGTLPSMVLDGDGAQQGRKKGRSARRNSI